MDLAMQLAILYVLLAFVYSMLMYVVVIPYLTARKLRSSINSVFGKEVIRDIMIQAMDSLKDEIEVKEANGEVKKTTVGALISSVFVASLADNLKMRFLGEKGLMSKELKNIEGDTFLQALPPNLAPLAANFLPLLRKYPIIAALGGMMLQNRGDNGGGSPPGLPAFNPPSQSGGFYGGM